MERELIGWSWPDVLLHLQDEQRSGTGEFEMSEQQYQAGDPIWWNWQQYLSGYAPQVIAVFVMKRNTAKKNAGIAVKMSNGSWQPKWVAIENIEKREV